VRACNLGNEAHASMIQSWLNGIVAFETVRFMGNQHHSHS